MCLIFSALPAANYNAFKVYILLVQAFTMTWTPWPCSCVCSRQRLYLESLLSFRSTTVMVEQQFKKNLAEQVAKLLTCL